MDQFRFKEISPKKMRAKAKKKLALHVNNARHRKTDERAKPNPQIKASAL